MEVCRQTWSWRVAESSISRSTGAIGRERRTGSSLSLWSCKAHPRRHTSPTGPHFLLPLPSIQGYEPIEASLIHTTTESMAIVAVSWRQAGRHGAGAAAQSSQLRCRTLALAYLSHRSTVLAAWGAEAHDFLHLVSTVPQGSVLEQVLGQEGNEWLTCDLDGGWDLIVQWFQHLKQCLQLLDQLPSHTLYIS